MKEKIEVMESVVEYIPNLMSGIERFNMNVEEGRLDEAQGLLKQILEGLEWVFQAISLTIDIYEQKIELTHLSDLFNEMTEAIENGDQLLMSDLLNYELLDILKDWNCTVKEELQRFN